MRKNKESSYCKKCIFKGKFTKSCYKNEYISGYGQGFENTKHHFIPSF